MPACRSGAAASGVLAKKADATAEEQARDMEKKVHALIEESAKLQQKADTNAGGWVGGHQPASQPRARAQPPQSISAPPYQ